MRNRSRKRARQTASQRPHCWGLGEIVASGGAAATKGLLLVGALARQDSRDRAHQDPEIRGQRLPANVLEVKAHPLVEADLAAARNLPQARDAGLHVETATLPGLVLVGLLGQRRAWADEAHVALDHVDELRQLVDRRRAQPLADARDARVAAQ